MKNEDEFDYGTSNKQVAKDTTTGRGNNAAETTIVQGATEAAESDVNKITVTVTDPSPIVILFGAGACGKTMTLIRLTNYLKSKGYIVEPERTFRPAYSKSYKEACDTFSSVVNSTDAPGRTNKLSFMLVKVMDEQGRPICQILEAPGEHYFTKEDPKREFPKYIKDFASYPNRRTWVFIVEKDWEDQQDRNNYAEKITEMQNQYVELKDKAIFTCHKADLHNALFTRGIPNEDLFFQAIKNQYPNIFKKYESKHPIKKHFKQYDFDFVVFSAGRFSDTEDKKKTYSPGSPDFPAKLWNAILKTVRGSKW